jgi:hypothetical protein
MRQAHALCLALGLSILPSASGSPGAVVRIDHRDPAAVPTRGPADAPVTVEEFFIPGTRSRAYDFLERLVDQHPSQIRLVYRVLGGNGSARLPYAALEAFAQGKFFELMHRLDCDACKPTNLTTPQILALGAEIGMDTDRLDAAMKNPPEAYDRVLKQNERRRQQRMRTTNTPSVLFSGRAPRTQLTAMTQADLEREYQSAKQRADDLIDRGADPRTLAEALDALGEDSGEPEVKAGPTDDDFDQPTGPPYLLATLPLAWTGLPSFGEPHAPVTIAILCSPASANCGSPLRAALHVQEALPDAVRVVWAPFFDPHSDDAAALAVLGDTALCAEQVGTSGDRDFDQASAGWHWAEALLSLSPTRRRATSADPLIDKLVDKLHVDRPAFAACRARIAGTTLAWIDRARRSGVHTSPATIIGGRIYPPVIDKDTVQQLVLAERAPGVLRQAVYWLGGLATVRVPRD